MTIDERLERLTERHEALTQSVELISADIDKVSKDIDRISKDIDKLGSGLRQAESLLVRMADGLATLSRIAQLHDERLDRLEGNA